MDFNKADKLLDNYFAGKTSLEEEKWLQEYFNSEEEMPPEQVYAADMFRFFRQEAASEYLENERPAARFRRGSLLKVASIAAAILIFIAALLFFQKPAEPFAYAYINGFPITDKETAMQETERTLALVSEKLNHSMADLSYLSRLTDIKEKFTKDK